MRAQSSFQPANANWSAQDKTGARTEMNKTPEPVVRRVCKICGQSEEEHHDPDWLEIPAGCVCDWGTWDYSGKTTLPPACKEYKGDGQKNCETCEHDKECHGS
jgi:hypothetical protein